jgi:hypothetical protein
VTSKCRKTSALTSALVVHWNHGSGRLTLAERQLVYNGLYVCQDTQTISGGILHVTSKCQKTSASTSALALHWNHESSQLTLADRQLVYNGLNVHQAIQRYLTTYNQTLASTLASTSASASASASWWVQCWLVGQMFTAQPVPIQM